MFDKSQLLKGILEGCILKCILSRPTYAYGAIEFLRGKGFTDLTEGTLYPLLLRLERQKLIYAELKESSVGPKRKYYFVTDEGKQYLEEFGREYFLLDKIVKNIMENENEKENE